MLHIGSICSHELAISSFSSIINTFSALCVAWTMADLHDDVTYEGWGKSSAAGHRECMGNSKCMLRRRSISSLRGKTNRLHAPIFATQGVGVFISEFAVYNNAEYNHKLTAVKDSQRDRALSHFPLSQRPHLLIICDPNLLNY